MNLHSIASNLIWGLGTRPEIRHWLLQCTNKLLKTQLQKIFRLVYCTSGRGQISSVFDRCSLGGHRLVEECSSFVVAHTVQSPVDEEACIVSLGELPIALGPVHLLHALEKLYKNNCKHLLGNNSYLNNCMIIGLASWLESPT